MSMVSWSKEGSEEAKRLDSLHVRNVRIELIRAGMLRDSCCYLMMEWLGVVVSGGFIGL